jgi:hypothetical protein
MPKRCRCTDSLLVAGTMVEIVFVVDEAPKVIRLHIVRDEILAP